MIDVSVIIPVKNENNKDIKRLVDNMLLQTHKPDEIILMDSSMEYKDDRINVIWMDCDRGKARNELVRIAKNEHVLCVDMSIYSCNYIEEMIKGFEYSDFISGRTECFGTNYFPFFIKTKYGSSRCIGFTKTLWKRVGGYPEGFDCGEDTEFNIKCSENAIMWDLPKAICFWENRKDFKALAKQFRHYGASDVNVNFTTEEKLKRYFLPVVIPIEIIKETIRSIKTILVVRLSYWTSFLKAHKR